MRNVGLIGHGYWGKIMKPYISEFFNLTQICNSKSDIDKCIYSNRDIRAVIVASSISTHYEIVKKCLKSDKHVFSEKPIAMTYKQAKELKELAYLNGLSLGVNYIQTFSPSLQFLANSTLIDQIGGIEFIDMSTKHLGKFNEYDVYWLLASHHLSILNMFWSLKQLNFTFHDNMYSQPRYSNLEDSYPEICTSGAICCTIPGYVGSDPRYANINVSVNHPEKEMKIIFYGSKGTIIYNPLDEERTIRVINYIPIYNKVNALEYWNRSYKFDEKNNLRYSMLYFKNLLDGKVKSNIDDAIEITRIIEERK